MLLRDHIEPLVGAAPVHTEEPHCISSQHFLLVFGGEILHRLNDFDRFRPRSHGIAVVEIAANDDVVVGPASDSFRQIFFPGYPI